MTTIFSSHPPAGRDFLAYWAAGHQLAHRASPYDAQTILAFEQSTGTSNGSAVVMRNPPTGFLLVLPLGLLPWREANLLWTAMLLAALAISITLVWKILEKPTDIVLVLGYTFAPALLCLYSGQSSLFLLLGVALFLRLHSTRPFLAGISLWLCLLKPHIFMPFGIVVLTWGLVHTQILTSRGMLFSHSLECRHRSIPGRCSLASLRLNDDKFRHRP